MIVKVFKYELHDKEGLQEVKMPKDSRVFFFEFSYIEGFPFIWAEFPVENEEILEKRYFQFVRTGIPASIGKGNLIMAKQKGTFIFNLYETKD